MGSAYVPPPNRPPPSAAPPRGAPPPRGLPPHASEASRLLCAGTYLDAGFRDKVIDELYRMEHRVVAPSLGFDAARVLAHALQARRMELFWSWCVLMLLLLGVVASGWWLVALVVPGLLLSFARRMRGTAADPPGRRRTFAFWLRWAGRLLLAYLLIATLYVGFGAADKGPFEPPPGADELSVPQAWLALASLLLMAVCVVRQQARYVEVLRGPLSPEHFPDAEIDPAEWAAEPRLRALKDRIRREQHAPLVMYHEAHPFCGAGVAHDTWVLAVELRPDPARERRPIGNGDVLASVRPFLEQLREVAEVSEREGQVVRDRLRQLRIDECVFLPAEGLDHRDDAPYDQRSFELHRAHAVEEGGEKRRHFLRIGVAGWEEELVVTVFVRVHTQGQMLMLEVAPHVLFPVRADFKDAHHEAYTFAHQNAFGKAVHIVTRMAGAPGEALVALGRRAVHAWRRMTGEFARGLPEGPAVSVRELAAEPAGSLFQSMDVDRYLKGVQDRIAYGVRAALAEAGYRTDEFAQKVVHISNGGVYIDSVAGSTFAVGGSARATTTSGGQPPPWRGPAPHGQ
ncbi:hypothetical protein [Streptomyces sedi]|uniref:Uncharacterized protein n=1 Tax=Streptomyces sedi TaxID=555059 RepID=A0A5C4VCC0_9ACTN|nr:hypothetical protein [Streptomyces sedi]TNM33501.1 hypothetical protein FH715_03870 [Streptomyces sedi]